MEFRLNKIDTELRQIVNEATKEGKVHGNKQLSSINKDGRRDKNNNSESFQEQLDKRTKEKILVEAIKVKEVNIEASKDDYVGDLNQGRFLDTKR